MNTIKQRVFALSQNLKLLYTDGHAITIAWWLLEKVTGKNKALLLVGSDSLSDEQEAQLKKWEDLLLNQKYPLQYILETVPFGPLELFVKPPTLIPRPETEQWCADLIEKLKPYKNENLTILDMCTGSGCIALWIAQALPQAIIHAVDISPQAIALSEKNAIHNNIKNITIIESDLFNALDDTIKYDIIISNPPYVTENEWQNLEPQVKVWEDKKALVADDNGLQLYKKITKESKKFLKNETILKDVPRIVFEIGNKQAEDVQSILHNEEYTKTEVVKDSADKDRVIYTFT
jgi:release factor glutamine methyltransferase